MQPRRVGKGVVAADGDQGIDLASVKDRKDVVSQIDGFCLGGPSPAIKKYRKVIGRHARRIGSRGMQDGPPGAVDTANVFRGQCRSNACRPGQILRIGIDQTGPAAPKSGYTPSPRMRFVDNGLDGGIQSGHIAPAGQDSQMHFSLRFRRRLL